MWFESEVFRGDPATGYPFEGPTSVSGVTHTHPQYQPGAFFLFDLGIVTLDTPVPGKTSWSMNWYRGVSTCNWYREVRAVISGFQNRSKKKNTGYQG